MNKSIIQIAGKFYKKCKVVMLPTNNPTLGGICKLIAPTPHRDEKIGGLFPIENFSYPTKWREGNDYARLYQPQHLYILSDEEIKEGDWYLMNDNLQQADKFLVSPESFYKIIASTDSELSVFIGNQLDGRTGIYDSFPRPSDSFIRKYCEKGGIDEVLIELTWTNKRISIGHTIREDYRPKVAKDNTISIKPLKDERFYIIYINESKLFFRGN